MRKSIVAGFVLATIAAAPASASPTPESIVTQLYAEYLPHHAPAMPSGSGPTGLAPRQPAEDKIGAFASHALRSQIDRQDRCRSASQGNCAIDTDYLIGGPDAELLGFRVERAKKRSHGLVVRAHFHEAAQPKDKAVSFFFVRENGSWKIDDVDAGLRLRLKEAIQAFFETHDDSGKTTPPTP